MGRLIDETGNVHGRLTVIERAENSDGYANWFCQCECGNKITVRGTSLRSGNTRSCGCLQREIARETDHFIDLAGQRFGRWFVKSRAKNANGGTAQWHCVCDCGVERVVMGPGLKNGRSKSCGCLQREIVSELYNSRLLPDGEGAFNALFASYRKQAKARDYHWKLTRGQFRKLTEQECFYCGKPPSNIQKGTKHGGDYIYNGVDRLLNTEGYTPQNCKGCCKTCNLAKSTMRAEEFLAWAEQVYNHSVAKDRA